MTATCKLGEKGCWNDGKCRATSNCENKVFTNADRIRAMTDEALAEFLAHDTLYEHAQADGQHNVLEWLQQPAEGE